MSRVLITGSTEGLGLMAARLLADDGHSVTLHAPVTQAWLAVSSDPDARVTGGYLYHQKPRTAHPAARDLEIQDRLLRYCAALTGVTL
ncbi:MAG TPA: hypothetical protein VIY52_16605 [Streptosporangiaceae bacterium]